ncbi:G-type lectin S-receptor-like serine/threonine-protein kinase At4g03230 isoform X2 [Magnolia sinica]|uniref:G-type lectin S-receptor-like serine/threonine-protein kinase At4g03230 isoform X2 n=1 Tax=Magnolia sinica TaxID=86752 RepID=UPI00265936E8|nr:G-type lectin S-receptor-like serine/threonine-protein kinase At4g03230 isoform X2 [Magnolia sinica]
MPKPDIFLLLSSFPLLCMLSCTATDSINAAQPIQDGETLISSTQTFELGFFSPKNSKNRYVGIWYHKITEHTVVWVANRENPLTDSSGAFSIAENGNFVVLDGNRNIVWSTNVSFQSNYTSMKLLDNGNLILVDRNSGTVRWQSFDHPSDTLLPGMKIGMNKKTGENRLLLSWKDVDNPAPGSYSFGLDPQDSNQFFIWVGLDRHWRSGYWNGRTFNKIPEASTDFLFHFITISNDDEVFFQYSALYDNTRMVMDVSGQIRCQVWYDTSKKWGLAWFEPRDRCSIYGACGAYGICNNHNQPFCKCMPGFEPASETEWGLGNWSGGCVRRMPLKCDGGDWFLSLGQMKVPDSESTVIVASEEECRKVCARNCRCSAYAYAKVSGGGASTCLVWFGNLMDGGDLRGEERDEGAQDLYIRLAGSELRSHKKRWLPLIVTVTIVMAAFLLGTLICRWKRRIDRIKGNREKMLNMSLFRLSTMDPSAYNFLDVAQLGGDGIQGLDIPFFHFEYIVTATDNFSDSNKLGQGGFGSVYKGELPGGQEIAVKRLSSGSGQGLEEFKNEVILIAKLQHRNLVRLLGYCVEGDEKMLLYEYLPNKSLDFFIFDEKRSKLLDWEKRFDIILGIARGLLYLHQDSRLKIIHRDLKTSNILLDEEMNPKISDFGIARIFGGNQTQANTHRVVGTYGYMSPEYALHGLFSMKSDVYSFGVMLLEIISGKKNNGFYDDERSLGLLGLAWLLWSEERWCDLVDPSISKTCDGNEVMKCIHVGLLCVQEDARNRPSMASVVMFLSEGATLPMPEEPAFHVRRNHSGKESSSYSKNEAVWVLEE